MFYIASFFSDSFAFLNVLRYVTFRGIASLMTGFLLVFLIMPFFIDFMKQKAKEGQPIRQEGPQSHFSKKGTPTMGGAVMLFAFLCTSLLWTDLRNPYVWILMAASLCYGTLGGYDDYLKLKKKHSDGLLAKQKFLYQWILAFVFVKMILIVQPDALKNILFFPFFKNVSVDLGIFYPFFASFVIVGTANAVNLTDGLDGLLIGPTLISCAVLSIFSYVTGHIFFSQYLYIPFIPGTAEIVILCTSLIGVGLGFLWYNASPAKIFMGDIGSLFLGAFLALVSLIIKQEVLLSILGGLFVAEALSVILQVAFFKKTRKRLFAMAPLHHHFEQKGWSETTVVLRFWIIAAFLGLLALATLKLR